MQQRMKSCLRDDSQRGDCKTKSVRIVSPIVWQSNDQRTLRQKQAFLENLSFVQLKAILQQNLAIDESEATYESCVEQLLSSEWIPSRDAIENYQRQRARPVRTASQKSEDRVRLCTLSNVSNLSSDEMKLWLIRNGARVPDGEGDAHRKEMACLIRNHMRVTTPCFKRKSAPKRPKKAKHVSHIQRKPGPPRSEKARDPQMAQWSRRQRRSAPEAEGLVTPIRGFSLPQTPPRNQRSCTSVVKGPAAETPIRKFALPQTPLQRANMFVTPKCSTESGSPKERTRSVQQTLSASPMMKLLAEAGLDESDEEEEEEKKDNGNTNPDHQQQRQGQGGGFLAALAWEHLEINCFDPVNEM